MFGDKVILEFGFKGDKVKIASTYLYYEIEEVFQKYYDVLKNEQLELNEISDREYQGRINIESDNEYLLLTIPYDEGWKITVDGEKAEVLKVQRALMAVKLEQGEHIIHMKFIPRGFILGACISFCGIVLFALLIIKDKIKGPIS